MLEALWLFLPLPVASLSIFNTVGDRRTQLSAPFRCSVSLPICLTLTCPDASQVARWQIVDELSTDETVPKLREMGINVIQPPDIVGVTYNWNLARAVLSRACCHAIQTSCLEDLCRLHKVDSGVACGGSYGTCAGAAPRPLGGELLCIACLVVRV